MAVNALVDTGKLITFYGDTAIDERLEKELNLRITPTTPRIGTAAKNSYLQAVGRTIGLRVKINETGRVLTVNPVVIRNFSIGINLGFLKRNGCRRLATGRVISR